LIYKLQDTLQDKSEDINGIIRSRKSKKNRQYNV
jgi:hypothetical protein